MALNIPTEGTKLNELKINIVDTQETFEAMKTANKINANELYFIEQESLIAADNLKTGHTFKVNLASENASTAFDGTADITDIGVSNTLPVKHGGTGFTTATYKNAVVIGNSSTVTDQLQTVRTASGAFYATGQDGKPSFGTLPVAQGGTGATSAANARTNLGLGTMATETAANYLKLAGGTMTGGVTFVGNQSSAWNDKGILFTNGSRIGENSSKALGLYSASTFYIRPDSGTASSGKGLEISSTAMIPSVNNEMELGSSDKKFKTVYATTLNGNLAWSNITSEPTTLSGYGITDAKINNGTITLGSNSITPLTSHQTVSNKGATLVWGSATTIATIGSTDIKVSLPANPNTDTKVTQNNVTAANDYRILLSTSANDTTETNTINKNTNLRYNPSTNTLSTGNISSAGNLTITGNTNLNGETYAESITAGSLLVNGNTNFVQIPTAPTPATTSNDTSIATTAFVKNNLGGLSGAMHFKGTTTTALNDGTTTAAVTIGGNSYTPSAGDVVLYSDSEFVWTGFIWERLGRDSSFKVTQTAVTDTAYNGTDTSTTFVTAITQNANGEITVTKRKLPTYNNYSHPTTTAVDATAVKVGKDNLGHVVLGDALTASDVSAFEKQAYNVGTLEAGIRPLVDQSRANRLVFLPANQIIIEKTTDGGTTWTDAGYTDAQKEALFTENNGAINIPLLNNAKSTQCGLRVTITGMKYTVPSGTAETAKYSYWKTANVTSTERYFNVREWWFWVSANNDTIRPQIYCATPASPDNWVTVFDSDFGMTGWSGSDWIRAGDGKTFGGGTNQTGNYWNWRLVFWSKIPDGKTAFQSATIQSIQQIRCYGDSVWTSSSNNLMAKDHLYSWDNSKNAAFPANITATQFNGIINGSLATSSIDIANGDKLVIIDSSNSNKITPSNTSFDGSTESSVLSKKGTWVALPTATSLNLSNYILKSTLSGAYDIMYSSAANTPTRLAANTTTTKKFLRMTGTGSAGAAPAWDTVTKSDVGLGNVENTALSTWTGSTAITTLGTISTGTVPWARLSNVPTTFTPASHTHGNLTNDGKISTTATIDSGDKLVIVDSDSTAASKITGSSITFGTSTTTFLSNKGTWVTPPGTYSLPLAASGTRGGIQIGYSESGNNYAVKLSSEKAYVTVPWTDTKNTAGSTDTSSKIYLIGATSQAVNPQTYSDDQIYATNGQLDANKVRVAEAISLVYDTTLQALNFVFA